jgi:pyruvate dehydrogenase E1 component beta subunit
MEGIDVELIDLRTVAPFDQSTIIESVAKTGRAVIVHEALRNFGVGAEIAAYISEHLHGQLKHRVLRMGAPQCPVPFSKVLENAFLPDKNAIAQTVRSSMGIAT